jgi:hypothetical protein
VRIRLCPGVGGSSPKPHLPTRYVHFNIATTLDAAEIILKGIL